MRLLEMVVVSVLVEILIPATVVVGLKKSKMLLPIMVVPVLLLGLADPSDMMHLVGRLAPAGPRLLLAIVLLLLAPPVDVLIRMFPPAVPVEDVEEPSTKQLVTVSFCAPFIRRIVLVPAVAEAVVFEMVSALPLPVSPLMVTFFAPFKSIVGLPAVVAPVTVRAPDGTTISEFQLPPAGLFRAAVAVPSSVFPTMVTVMLLPVWLVFALIASKAAFNVG